MVEKKQAQLEGLKYPALMLGGSVIIALLLIFFVGKPMWNSMQKTSRELEEQKETLAKLETKLENLKNLKAKEAELKEKNAKTLAALPQDKDVARLFVQLESIATQSGMTVKSVGEAQTTGTTQTTEPANALILPVNYVFSGKADSYLQVKDLLTKAEQALRLVSFTNVDVSANSDGTLDVNISATTYKRGQK